MQKILLYKVLIISGLAILLLIPLSIVEGIIDERKEFRHKAIQDVAKSSTGRQKITGALLVIPYQKRVVKDTVVHENGEKHTVQKEVLEQKYHYLLPEILDIDGYIETKELYRGIYKVPTYLAKLSLKGHFILPENLGLPISANQIVWQKPYLSVGVKDVRGIHRTIKVQADGKQRVVSPGSKAGFLEQGVHSSLNVEDLKKRELNFSVDLELQGMEQLSLSPIGRFTQIKLSSKWPHPSFIGDFLPKSREIDEEGFGAQWETSFFASNMQHHLDKCVVKQQCTPFLSSSLGLSLHQGVDIYLQSERSTKYALLFIGLTFVAFFLFEVLKNMPIHPVQYGLVGVSLALFYFLLISLSEHIAFSFAYSIAACSCIGLLGFYISFILKSLSKSLIFAGALIGLYIALYLLIQSEDYALLLGSILLFVVLALVMIITRNVNWYQVESMAKNSLPEKATE